MKSNTYQDRIAAANADSEAKHKAIRAALSPEEQARREERQKQIEDQAARAMSAFKTYPYALTAALSHGAMPIQGAADPRIIGDKSFHDYQSALFGRLGLDATVPVTVHQKWKAARSVGFTPEEFGRMSDVDLCEVLEAKATVLERLRGRDYSEIQDALHKALSIRGGRPPGIPVDGETLKDLRMSCDTSQEGLALTCGVSIDSISRGEAGGRWSDDVFEKVADGLASILKRRVSPEELKRK